MAYGMFQFNRKVELKMKKSKFRITYNAPITLTFALLSVIILFLDTTFLNHTFIRALFIAPGCQGASHAFDYHNALDYFRLFSYILGHSDWNHLLSNFSIILLLGPILEERYGSFVLLVMILVTAFVTSAINACLIPCGLLGSSGIVFMMILLASFSTMSRHEIPLSFFLILFLYLGRELFASSSNKLNNISTFAHIAGGICGSMFGFLSAAKKRPVAKTLKNETKAAAGALKTKKAADTKLPEVSDNTIAEELAMLTMDENSPRFKK